MDENQRLEKIIAAVQKLVTARAELQALIGPSTKPFEELIPRNWRLTNKPTKKELVETDTAATPSRKKSAAKKWAKKQGMSAEHKHNLRAGHARYYAKLRKEKRATQKMEAEKKVTRAQKKGTKRGHGKQDGDSAMAPIESVETGNTPSATWAGTTIGRDGN